MSEEKNYTMMGHDTCPVCETTLDAVTSLADKEYKPNPNDLTICCHCLSVLKYEDDMALAQFPLILFEGLDCDTKTQILLTQTTTYKVVPPKSDRHLELRDKHVKELFERLEE